jgi:hypothetical protein
LAVDDDGFMPRLAEWAAHMGCLLFALPHENQAMLISRKLYDRLGGFREDSGFVQRLKRSEKVMLKSRAVMYAPPRSEGYATPALRQLGQALLSPVRALARLYG